MTGPQELDTVTSLYYQGYTRDEIHSRTGISTGKISNLIAIEKSKLADGNVDAIRLAGQELLKAGKTWRDMAEAVALKNYCESHGLDIEQLKDNIPKIQQKCEKHGLSLADLPLDTDEKVKAVGELDTTASALKQDIADLVAAKEQKLKNLGHTDESLAKCRRLTDFLDAHNLNPDSPQKLRNAIQNAEEAGYNGKVLAERAASADMQSAQMKKIEEVIRQQGRQERENQRRLNEQQASIKVNSTLIAETDSLKALGVTLPILRAISDTAKRVGVANRMTEKQAMDKLTTDILTKYEPLTGFEQASYEIRKEIAEEESMLEKLMIEHAQYGRAIDALKTVLSHGGATSDILAIKHAIESDGLTLSDLHAKISLYGSLDNTYRELEKQVKDLEAKRVALDSALSLLENKTSGLKEFLASADVTIKKQVQSMIDTTHDAAEVISKTVAQANKDISDARGTVIEDLAAIGNKANEITKQYARTHGVLVFEPLIRVVNGEKIDAKQVRDAVLFAMSILIPFLPSHSDHRYRLEGAMQNLKEDITFGLFS